MSRRSVFNSEADAQVITPNLTKNTQITLQINKETQPARMGVVEDRSELGLTFKLLGLCWQWVGERIDPLGLAAGFRDGANI